MTFSVGAEAYDRFMGRYSTPLAARFAEFAGVVGPQQVLDVGCGPGALTGELASRLDPGCVSALDPSEPFAHAARARHPEVSVVRAAAENLPFDAGRFDAALAQLVVHFMADPFAGVREMARVVCEGGVVAACVWDHAGGRGPLSLFWQAARALDRAVADESGLAGAREGHLGELFRAAGLHQVEQATLSVGIEHPSFDEWWGPFALGVGPAGAYVAGLDAERREALRERCRVMLPAPPFTSTVIAWAARGIAGPPPAGGRQ